MNKTLYMLILVAVMALVTYIIRLIPFVCFKKKIKSTLSTNNLQVCFIYYGKEGKTC